MRCRAPARQRDRRSDGINQCTNHYQWQLLQREAAGCAPRLPSQEGCDGCSGKPLVESSLYRLFLARVEAFSIPVWRCLWMRGSVSTARGVASSTHYGYERRYAWLDTNKPSVWSRLSAGEALLEEANVTAASERDRRTPSSSAWRVGLSTPGQAPSALSRRRCRRPTRREPASRRRFRYSCVSLLECARWLKPRRTHAGRADVSRSSEPLACK